MRRAPRINGGRAAVVTVALSCALVTAAVAANHVLAIQVVGAAAGGLITTGGVAVAVWSWPQRRISEPRQLLTALGFFLISVGVFGMLAGAGLYH